MGILIGVVVTIGVLMIFSLCRISSMCSRMEEELDKKQEEETKQ